MRLTRRKRLNLEKKELLLTTVQFNISKEVRVPGVVKVETGNEYAVTSAGTFIISEKVRVPGRVGEEIESDVRMTGAGIFKISKKVCVDEKKNEKKKN